METNSPNGSGKGSWRERLGIGSKELPKIANEFAGKPGEPKFAPRPAPARAQTVTKPAPMAPRPAPGPRPPAAPARPAIAPQGASESLADRLRAQRAAAERLAEQRVAAAKERAPTAVNGSGRRADEPKPGERPKFSFADEQPAPPAAAPGPPSTPPPAPATPPLVAAGPPKRDLPPPPRVSASPIVPPRPALGGEPPRPDPLRGRPGLPPYQSQFTPPPPGGYRPLDPPGYQYQPRPPTRPYTPPSYGGPPSMEPRLAPPPPPQPRGGGRRPIEDEEFYDDAPRRPRPVSRGRALEVEDDLDEVFEDDAPPQPPRRRASAQDYGRAYREYEDEFGDSERRRSRGPFMVLAGLVALAALIGGGIWYYNNFHKARVSSTTNAGEVPVVTAPADPAKVDPPAAEQQPLANDAAPAAKAKRFYDRILGEQTIDGGQMVPTEEAPVVPAPGTSGSAEPLPDPATATGSPETVDPALAPGDDPATEALPLPLPPPGAGDTQGALTPPKSDASASAEKVIPTAAVVEDALAPVPGETPLPQEPATTAAVAAPADPTATDPAVKAAIDNPDAPTGSTDTAVEEIQPAVKKPKLKSAKTKKRAKKPEERTASLGTKPVVLVAPEATEATDAAAGQVLPPPEAIAVPEAQPESGSFFKRKSPAPSGKGADNRLPQQTGIVRKNFKSGTISATPAPTDAPQQVASIAEDTIEAPAPAPEATGSTGRYVVQLGSFRTQAEAQSEASRLKTKTAALSGVGTSVVRATVFGSSRYRVMTSPVADRATGERICEALLAANEPNCSVKSQ